MTETGRWPADTAGDSGAPGAASHNARGGPLGDSRRKFMRDAVRAGSVASAALWVAPQVTSVALARESAGSPPPTTTTSPPQTAASTTTSTTTSTTAPSVGPAGTTSSTTAPSGTATTDSAGSSGGRRPARQGGGGGGGGGGGLPFTGADPRFLVATGGSAIVVGGALLELSRHLDEGVRPEPQPPER